MCNDTPFSGIRLCDTPLIITKELLITLIEQLDDEDLDRIYYELQALQVVDDD